MVEPTSPPVHTPTWWIVHAGPWVAVLAAVAFGVAHGATAELYRPLGITPAQAGFGTADTIVQTGSLLALLAVLLVSLAATALVAEQVSASISRRALARRPAARALPALAILGPITVLGMEAWALDGSTAWAWAAGVTLAATAALWVVAVRDEGGSRRRTAVAAVAGATLAGSTVAAAWAAPTTAAAVLVTAFLAVAVAAILFGDAPEWLRARRYLPVLLLLSAVGVTAAISQETVAIWALLALPFAALGAWVGQTGGAGRQHLRRGLQRARLADAPRLDRVLVAVALIGASAAATAAVWTAAGRDGRHLLATGEAQGIFATHVFPARIMLRYDGVDPMGVCRSRRTATVVGADDRATYVLLAQDRSSRRRPGIPLVVPLPLDTYVVTTGVAGPGRCVSAD